MKQSADLKRLLTSIDHKAIRLTRMCAALMILIRIFYPSTMYRVTRLHLLPRSVSRSATRKPDFRQNSLIRRGKKQRLKITCSAVFPVKSVVFLSRQKVLEKVV